mmetsp:Transcript_96011/g.277260  ORF Transcript_96011/g.277260 Transcript_96011/m.277260 type:complete len:227 (-) Transcript_96011:219-899(-)
MRWAWGYALWNKRGNTTRLELHAAQNLADVTRRRSARRWQRQQTLAASGPGLAHSKSFTHLCCALVAEWQASRWQGAPSVVRRDAAAAARISAATWISATARGSSCGMRPPRPVPTAPWRGCALGRPPRGPRGGGGRQRCGTRPDRRPLAPRAPPSSAGCVRASPCKGASCNGARPRPMRGGGRCPAPLQSWLLQTCRRRRRPLRRRRPWRPCRRPAGAAPGRKGS